MRVGVDITPLQVVSPGGIGTSTYEILRRLEQTPDVDVIMYGRREPVVPFEGVPVEIDAPLRLGSGAWSRLGNIAWIQRGLGPMLAEDRVDVFWGTRTVLPVNAPAIPMVGTLYDFWYARYPEQQPVVNRTLNRRVTGDMIRDADVLCAISDATARDAVELYPASAAKVRTVHLGVDAEGFRMPEPEVAERLARLGVTRPYVLAIDVYNARKNFDSVLDACALLAGEAAGAAGLPPTFGELAVDACCPPLDGFGIVGLGTPRATANEIDVPARATALGLGARLRLLGDVSFGDLRALYAGAKAFVYPSIYEGFGMPVLEAMSAGAPVVCSKTSSLPEVAGDAALLVAPESAHEIAGALRRVLGDETEAAQLREAGRARAAEFTWQRTADAMLAAFRDAIAAHAR